MSQPLSCNWTEYSCKVKPVSSGFCKKHHIRGTLLKEAKERGIRICDDGKRPCRNETVNNKVRCEECLTKIREKDNEKYNERKEAGLCTMCGVTIESLTKGIMHSNIQNCEKCYSTMRAVEDKRQRDPRNFSSEKKTNPMKHFREYNMSAAKRNLQFELDLDTFTEIVNKPCHYCNTYNEFEVIGIDRIDSFKGYVKGNVLPCCMICNFMKQQLTMREFSVHIEKIYNNFACNFSETTEPEEDALPSYKIKPKEIVSLYSKKNLDAYIDMCVEDERSASYIEKLTDATKYSMSTTEFRSYLENANRIEIRSQDLTLDERKRVPRKEIYGLLALNKPTEVVKLYESVFGNTKNIRNDMEEVALTWNSKEDSLRKEELEILFIKYNNARAYNKRMSVQEDSKSVTTTVSESPQQIQTPSYTVAESLPGQWKVSNILSAFRNNTENLYKTYLEESKNAKSLKDWDKRWNTFSEFVKGHEKEESEKYIRDFILSLRTLRHNAMCYEKNNSLLDREDRQVWKNDTILRAFKLNDLSKFKAFTEENTGESPENSVWKKRWNEFVDSVNNETEDTNKKTLISKFLTAQRTKKYRHGLKKSEDTRHLTNTL